MNGAGSNEFKYRPGVTSYGMFTTAYCFSASFCLTGLLFRQEVNKTDTPSDINKCMINEISFLT